MVAIRPYSSRPVFVHLPRACATVSCCHVAATVRSSVKRVDGEARMTPSRQPSSLSIASCSWAARTNVSSGTNMTDGRATARIAASTTPGRACRGGRAPVARDRRDGGCDLVVFGLTGVEVRGQWGLCVDDDPLPSRDPDDEIGAEQRALGVSRRGLARGSRRVSIPAASTTLRARTGPSVHARAASAAPWTRLPVSSRSRSCVLASVFRCCVTAPYASWRTPPCRSSVGPSAPASPWRART